MNSTLTNRCGTITGTRRHYAAGEKPCEPCRTARNIQQRTQRAAVARARAASPANKAGAKPLPDWAPFGRHAGRQTLHDFRSMGGQCLECWGWPDDPRHPVVTR